MGQRLVELTKQQMQKESCINLCQAFEYLDRDQDGYIDNEQIRDFMSMNGFYGTERELMGLMQRMDTLKSGRVSKSQFLNALTPKMNGLI